MHLSILSVIFTLSIGFHCNLLDFSHRIDVYNLCTKMVFVKAFAMEPNSPIGILVAFDDEKRHTWSYDNAMVLVFIYVIFVLFRLF